MHSYRFLRLAALIAAAVVTADCTSDSITRSEDSGQKATTLSILSCTAALSTRSLSCAETTDPLKPHYSMSVVPGEARNAIIIGGQRINVEVTTSNITNDTIANHFAFDLSIRNLRPQPIGTSNGTSTDSSIAVFFHSGPTTTLGSGSITVFNATGTRTFTAPSQPYFTYAEMIAQGATSTSRNWILAYDETVQTFSFQLLISANVPKPDGYIDVYASPDSVVPSGTIQMQDTVRDALGYPTTDQSGTWSVSDSTKASISSSGLFTAVSPGLVTVTAAQGTKAGSKVIKIIGASDADSDGFTVAQGDCNDSNASIYPGAADNPDPNFTDSDCDGIDGTKTLSVFVSKSGADVVGCGSYASPCFTINNGNTRAIALGRTRVLVAAGTYAESVTLQNGISIHGGYSSDFTTRSLANRATISGSSQYQSTGLYYAVIGASLTVPSSFDMMIVQGPDASGQRADGSGRHSAAMFLSTIGSNVLTVSYVGITAGNGGNGIAGSNGSDADQTSPGTGANGGDGAEYTTSCDNTNHGAGGAAGGSGARAGGKGGDGGTMDTDCGFLSSNFNATRGQDGSNAATFSATYGKGGQGGSGTELCGPTQDGQNGFETDGANGLGGSTWSSASGILVAAAGTAGALGEDGTGGGGGGGSGGCDSGTDAYGAGGGGGGAGGVRAPNAGTGGMGGGASVGIYLYQANPALVNLEITRGAGGAGGAGGTGGKGQPGGLGGQGGVHPGSAAPGNGGNGAAGGYAGAGGGGAGGISTGILKVGGSTTTETSVNVSGGAAGNGGAGGARGDGSSAGSGSNGALTSSTVIS